VLRGELAHDPAVASFTAGETKRQVFDFTVGNDLAANSLAPGTYTVRSGFGGRWVSQAPFVIVP
jgi:hypothetical protein